MNDLTSDQLGELMERFGSLRRAGVWAVQSGPYAEELAANGATIKDAPDGPYWTLSEWSREPLFWRLVYASHTATVSTEATGQRGDGAGRPLGAYVETETFWEVWEMALDKTKSARAIARATDKNPDLQFVNKDKAGVIRAAVAKNFAAARRALPDREIPPGFSDTPYGIKLPQRKPA